MPAALTSFSVTAPKVSWSEPARASARTSEVDGATTIASATTTIRRKDVDRMRITPLETGPIPASPESIQSRRILTCRRGGLDRLAPPGHAPPRVPGIEPMACAARILQGVTTSPRPQAPPAGLTVGGYTLRARLGEGGMGVVHLGQKPGERPVAIKVLRPHVVGDDEARRRLAREVSSLTRVRSRRIAEIVDSDPWGDIPYVATRYVPGLSLHDHVQEEGPLAGDDLLWFADCLAEALEAVHSVGVLHRDVKPSNVIMEGRTPILIDFGLARVAEDSRITMNGWLLGTPGYLAPEILYGDDATVASDVHAWAATVAYAGTGRAPFGRGPSVAIMDRVRRGEHDLTGLDPVVLELVEEALAPAAEDRPSLDEVRDWIEDLADGEPREPRVLPHPVTLPYAAAAFQDHEAPTRVGTARPSSRTPVHWSSDWGAGRGSTTTAVRTRDDHTVPQRADPGAAGRHHRVRLRRVRSRPARARAGGGARTSFAPAARGGRCGHRRGRLRALDRPRRGRGRRLDPAQRLDRRQLVGQPAQPPRRPLVRRHPGDARRPVARRGRARRHRAPALLEPRHRRRGRPASASRRRSR